MKFVLKEFSAASRVANIFGGVAVRPEMEADGAALKFRTEMRDALAVRMIAPTVGARCCRHASDSRTLKRM